ncbi:MAG: hypothetical protein ACKO3A_00005 [Opitutia bacterium]
MPSRSGQWTEDTTMLPTSTNAFVLLGDDDEKGKDDDTEGTADASTPPRPPELRPTAHGWDSFLASLDAKNKGALGTVDELLINYANFAGKEFRTFDRESEKMMACLKAMEDRLDEDHDEVVGTRTDLSKLAVIVTANANGISAINNTIAHLTDTMMENATTIKELSRLVATTMAQLYEVRTTADNAFRMATTATNYAKNAFNLASTATPTITGQGVRLDGLSDDVSHMSSDIDSPRASLKSSSDPTSKLENLEGAVSRINENSRPFGSSLRIGPLVIPPLGTRVLVRQRLQLRCRRMALTGPLRRTAVTRPLQTIRVHRRHQGSRLMMTSVSHALLPHVTLSFLRSILPPCNIHMMTQLRVTQGTWMPCL